MYILKHTRFTQKSLCTIYPLATSRDLHHQDIVSSDHMQFIPHHFIFVNYKSLHQWCLNVQRQFKFLIIHGIRYTFHDQNIFVFTILMRFLFNVPRKCCIFKLTLFFNSQSQKADLMDYITLTLG